MKCAERSRSALLRLSPRATFKKDASNGECLNHIMVNQKWSLDDDDGLEVLQVNGRQVWFQGHLDDDQGCGSATGDELILQEN